ncbi:MAG: lipase maturation factor family protein [Gemmatimonadales bacterium]
MPNETYLRSRWLFLRLLGVVYLIAFGSIAVQITGLVGEHGILPATEFLKWAHSTYGAGAYTALPTVFWLGAGDTALRVVAWTGVGLAVLLVLGLAPWVALLLLWALYLSISVAGQDFLSFQWDALLLEAGLASLLWAPMQWLPRWGEQEPSPLPRWLLVFLLFKLVFLSGATKLLSGDPTWRSLTALDFHFETQPLPTWVAWYAHHLPAVVHRLMTLGSLAIEIVVPWLVLLPSHYRRLRLFAFIALVSLQLAIAATGNYGFFNLLAIVLCVPLLDDRMLARVVPIVLAPRGESAPRRPWVLGAVSIAFFVPSVLSGVREMAGPAPGTAVLRMVAPLRSFNGYGLFRVMTTARREILIEGSRDGEHWSEYGFPDKPGDVFRRPAFVEPYHPRLDWQMWFAALDPAGSSEWLVALADRLRAGTPEVLALMGRNPFPGAPPRSIRFVVYDYHFSTAGERRRTGAWWTRAPLGVMPAGP